ncbi:hypothetical protein HMPREF9370_1803 [Neisseria wadsworthii 9715]|uniref:Uncharacterized protein n=1 Tax=Neisseria wadsworthii 9715 TaxID=1030841 RepID=G4CRU3_9NEIS|nr:hypothetical protein HMPREF9370_1803 [Neisseria wadsworthii 9715]
MCWLVLDTETFYIMVACDDWPVCGLKVGVIGYLIAQLSV